ncbi:MAG: transcription antitermination factor NusB [Gammaproteobacteria bacterium]|nr:transcription antitermination factor NusB [Gammaproteobacteria bacterium]
MTESGPERPPGAAAASGSNQGRVRARRCAVQALYQWHLAGAAPDAIIAEFLGEREVDKIDVEYFATLTRDIPRHEPALRAALLPVLDRPWERIGPVERSVLLLGAYELAHCPHIPWRVVVNEGVELCKMFGADEAHRYVNGVLDKLARQLRSLEVAALGR